VIEWLGGWGGMTQHPVRSARSSGGGSYCCAKRTSRSPFGSAGTTCP